MKIIWSNQAKITYERIIDDIPEKWTPNIAKDFENKTNSLLEILKKQNLRKCVIHKNTSLIYITNDSNIELVTFIDNRTNHNF